MTQIERLLYEIMEEDCVAGWALLRPEVFSLIRATHHAAQGGVLEVFTHDMIR